MIELKPSTFDPIQAAIVGAALFLGFGGHRRLRGPMAGTSRFEGFCWGLILGPLGVLMIALMPDPPDDRPADHGRRPHGPTGLRSMSEAFLISMMPSHRPSGEKARWSCGMPTAPFDEIPLAALIDIPEADRPRGDRGHATAIGRERHAAEGPPVVDRARGDRSARALEGQVGAEGRPIVGEVVQPHPAAEGMLAGGGQGPAVGAKATDRTANFWGSSRRARRRRPGTSQRPRLGPPAIASVLPSGEKASDVTRAEVASMRPASRPPATSQRITVLSVPPEARVLPSGANATAGTHAR